MIILWCYLTSWWSLINSTTQAAWWVFDRLSTAMVFRLIGCSDVAWGCCCIIAPSCCQFQMKNTNVFRVATTTYCLKAPSLSREADTTPHYVVGLSTRGGQIDPKLTDSYVSFWKSILASKGLIPRFLGLITDHWEQYWPIPITNHKVYLMPTIYCVRLFHYS